MTRKCYRCGVQLTGSNQSKEHIIPNACGGRWYSYDLLCKDCNSKLGDSIDNELAKQVNDIANLLQIKRHKGTPNPTQGILESSGETYSIQPSGKPVKSHPKIDNESDDNQISIRAKNESQLRQVLQGLKRKNPEIDVENLVKYAQKEKVFLNEPIKIKQQVGGKNIFRAVTKIAINFFIEKTGKINDIKNILPFINGGKNNDFAWIHYPNKEIYKPNENEVSHVIHLKGKQNENILYCYIELFNCFNFIVFLNDNYSGDDLDICYIYDVLEQKHLSKKTNLNYTKSKLTEIFDNKDTQNNHTKNIYNFRDKLERIVYFCQYRQWNNYKNYLISKAIQKTFGKYPEGTLITQEIINEFLNELISEELIYSLFHPHNS